MEKNKENLSPRDLIKKHIENKDHVVTDEELQTVKVGQQAGSEEANRKEVDARKEELESTPHLPNPYDVL